MSQVFLATDNRHQRRVVIKLLPPSLTAAISTERFEREILLSAALQHPNIVPVLSSGKVSGLPYFVMPFIEGESVRARVRRGPLSVRETVNVLKDVTRALAFAHDRGVVHRDIKPDNVLLSAGVGAAVVTDFGVAKALLTSRRGERPSSGSGITGVGISLGTPAYMAPEQAAADPNVDHRADLYALGILGYEMLAGAPPFSGRSPQALLAAQMTEAPTPLSARRYDVPQALVDLIMQCLAKEPAKRPESAAVLARALEDPDVISGVFAAPSSAGKNRWRRAALLAAGAGVLYVGGQWWRSRQPGDTLPAASAAVIEQRSVAVLPLLPVGGDARARDVAQALGAELSTGLSSVPGMRVASQAGVTAALDTVRAPREVAARLGVAYVVEGSVQRERSALRATVRFVRVATDSTVWSGTFNGSADSALTFQAGVVRSVVEGVRRD